MTRPNSGERPESGPEIVNLTGYTSLAKSVVFCMSSSFFFFFALATLRLLGLEFLMDLGKILFSLQGGFFVEEALCMSGPGSGGDCIGGDGVGEEQNHASGSLALRLHLEDF